MAAIENLEIIVDVDIASAVAALEDLQDELRDVAETIEAVDARGAEGIDIRTSVDDAESELARLKAEIEAFEAANEINLDTDIDKDLTGPGFQTLSSPTAAGPDELAQGMDWLFDDPEFDFSFAMSRRRLGGFGGDRGRLFRKLRGTIDDVIERMDNFDLRMSDIHNAMARLVPLLLIFIGTLPAVVTALVGLAAAAVAAAAALAAITGFGALGVALQDGQFDMQRLTDVWEDIRDSFIDAFAPLAERLQPLFEDAVSGLEMFFQAIARQGDALMALTDDARAFGGFLMDFVPTFLRALAGLAEALGPILGNIADWLNRNFENIMRSLVRLTAEATPHVAALLQTVAAAIPPIVRMSVAFTMVATAVLRVFGAIADLLGIFGFTAESIGLLVASTLALATAVLLLRSRVISLIIDGLLKLATAIFTYVFPAIMNAIVGFFGFSAATFLASAALAAFITLATLGAGIALVGMATSAAAGFLGLSDSIDSATSSLKDFNKVSGRAGAGGDFNPYGQGGGGAAAANVTGSGGGGARGGDTVINIESSGDRDEDRSNAKYAGWIDGRTTGETN